MKLRSMGLRWLAVPLLLSLSLTGSGCVLRLGSYEDTGESTPPSGSAPPISILPTPINAPASVPPLENEAQRARWEESEWYTVNTVYQGGTPVHAFQLPSGDIVDFVARSTLPGLPYNLSDLLPDLPLSLDSVTLPPGVELGVTELEQVPELAELLADTVPFLRPTFGRYILGEAPDATSIEDYLERYQVGGHEGGVPSGGVNRLYAGLVSPEPNRGISGLMNQFDPEVADGSFSLLEFAVFCPAEGPTQEMIGVAISVDRANGFGKDHYKLPDHDPRLHVEYANAQAGYVWDGQDGKLMANPLRIHHPGEKVPVSVVDGMQVEHLMGIFQSPAGDWWIMYKGDLLGYYPASLFTMLNKGACASAWYGEVYNDTPGTVLKTKMGSGRFPEAGKFKIAYVREPKYYDFLWKQVEPQDLVSMEPYKPLCFGRSPLTGGVLGIGGPGSFNSPCQWP